MTDRENEHDGRGGPTWGRAGERPGAPRAADQLGDGARRRPPAAATAQAVQTWVDQAISQAQRQGAFDNLPGAGKPLRDVDTRADPDWWVRGLVERENLDLGAVLPGVLQLRREKAGLPETLAALPDEEAVRAHLEDFNERVLADRRRPYAGTGSPPVVGRVDVEETVDAWRATRAERAAAAPTPAEAEDFPEPGIAARNESRSHGKGWWRRRRRS